MNQDERCPCKHEAKLTALEQKDSHIAESLAELKTNVNLILMQVTKVAVLEVNHNHQDDALKRAFGKIEKLEIDVANIAKETKSAISVMEKEMKAELTTQVNGMRTDINELAKETREFMNQMKGMSRMAWLIWSTMGIALFALFIKIVFGAH